MDTGFAVPDFFLLIEIQFCNFPNLLYFHSEFETRALETVDLYCNSKLQMIFQVYHVPECNISSR